MNGLKLPSTFASRRPAMPLLAALLISFLPGSRPRGDAVAATSPADLGPAALAISSDARWCYIACAVSREVLVFDTERQRIALRWSTPAAPSGLVLSADGKRLFVTCAAPGSQVCVFDAGSGRLLKKLAAGHTALGPVLSRDEKTLFVCNRFNHALSFIDVSSGAEIVRVPVSREPVSAALAPDGAFLLVANHLPSGRSDTNYVAAAARATTSLYAARNPSRIEAGER